MSLLSARTIIGLPVTTPSTLGEGSPPESVIGIVENVVIDPHHYIVEGFLIGEAGTPHRPCFVPRECLVETNKYTLCVNYRTCDKPPASQRILSLAAFTTNPKVLVGFVYDFSFSPENGLIDHITVHQLIRTWQIPLSSIEAITPRALLINQATIAKLKMKPYPTELGPS